MCDLTITIKPPLLSIICGIYGLIICGLNTPTDYWEKIHLMSFLLITKRIPNGIDI